MVERPSIEQPCDVKLMNTLEWRFFTIKLISTKVISFLWSSERCKYLHMHISNYCIYCNCRYSCDTFCHGWYPIVSWIASCTSIYVFVHTIFQIYPPMFTSYICDVYIPMIHTMNIFPAKIRTLSSRGRYLRHDIYGMFLTRPMYMLLVLKPSFHGRS